MIMYLPVPLKTPCLPKTIPDLRSNADQANPLPDKRLPAGSVLRDEEPPIRVVSCTDFTAFAALGIVPDSIRMHAETDRFVK